MWLGFQVEKWQLKLTCVRSKDFIDIRIIRSIGLGTPKAYSKQYCSASDGYGLSMLLCTNISIINLKRLAKLVKVNILKWLETSLVKFFRFVILRRLQ